MHPELDNNMVKGLLVSLGFNNLTEPYLKIDAPKDDKALLENASNNFIPDFTSYRGVYIPNRRHITLTRTLTLGNHMDTFMADSWNFETRSGLGAGITIASYEKYNKRGKRRYSPRGIDTLRSHNQDLDSVLKAEHENLPNDALFTDRIRLVYDQLLKYNSTPNAHTPRR